MKIKLIALLAGSMSFLVGCGNNGGNTSTEPAPTTSTPTSPTTSNPTSEPPVPVYTVTDSEYLLAKSIFASSRILINGNLTITSDKAIKIAEGKVDYVNGTNHQVYDIDKASYDSGAGTVEADEYNYYTSGWIKTHHDSIPLDSIYGSYELYYFTALLGSIGDYTYSETTHKYTGTNSLLNITFSLAFENTKLVSAVMSGEVAVTYTMSSYGTTIVDVPVAS